MRILATALLLTACTHSIHHVHTSSFEPYGGFGDGNPISAQSEQFVVMGFAGNTDYVEQAQKDLMSQCSGGRIKGISTQYSTSHGFFSWTNKILMQGMCIPKTS